MSEPLEREGAYKIRSGQLARLGPGRAAQQENEIKEFAEEHGWDVSRYCAGTHAIIVKKASWVSQ
jgi:hypothetical protein